MAKKKSKAVESSGKRKTAIARATVKAGKGRVRVNSEPIEILQPSLARRKAMEPLIIADAMNSVGAKSNSGEGGEDKNRLNSKLNSNIILNFFGFC